MSRLIYVRHAQASFMKKDYDELSDLGRKQAAILGSYLAARREKFDKIYFGPLKRHRQTMEIVGEAYLSADLPWPEPELVQGLDEHRGPEVMNLIMPKLRQTNEKVKTWTTQIEANPEQKRRIHLQMFTYIMGEWAKGNLQVEHPGYKTWDAFRQQVREGLQHILESSGRGVNVVAFTSGGTTAAAVGHVLGMNDQEKVMSLNGIVQNTALTEFLFSKDKLTLKSFNRIPHLPAADLQTFV